MSRDSRARGAQLGRASLVDRAFGGTFGALVQHFVAAERMSKREREQLREMLADDAHRGER